MIPDPLQMLTYFAARTQRVDLATMVIVLPWHNPVRVAEQLAMLQHRPEATARSWRVSGEAPGGGSTAASGPT